MYDFAIKHQRINIGTYSDETIKQLIERIAEAENEVKFLQSAPCPFKEENEELKAKLAQMEAPVSDGELFEMDRAYYGDGSPVTFRTALRRVGNFLISARAEGGTHDQTSRSEAEDGQ